jgi:hypothetical protein
MLEDFHEDIACRALWCGVIKDATEAAQRGDVHAQMWFDSDVWIQISRLMFPEHQRNAIRAEALKNVGVLVEPAHVDHEQRAETKRVRERQRYRQRTGFYDRRGLPTQESAPCPVSFA